jgi:tripartite-type tricarboxylate transporter receptor subunit TctC
MMRLEVPEGLVNAALRLFSKPLGVLSCVAVCLALVTPSGVRAQGWPTKPVRIVVPFAAGGTADLLARIVGEAMQASTGKPFVVEGKTGAGGALAAAEVARASADGHTILLATSSTHSVAPAVRKNLPYDAVNDFTPITLLANANNLLLVSPTVEIKSISDLIALARQKPKYLNYASGGIGTHTHLAFEALQMAAGIELTHVPYKGTAASITDLVGGAVHMTWDSLPTGLPNVKAGRVRGIAVSGASRSAIAPEIPTVGETVKGYAVTTWYGLYGPRGMPADLVMQINREINKALHKPEMAARFVQTLGIEPPQTTPAEFAAVAAAERERWAQLVRERDIKMD